VAWSFGARGSWWCYSGRGYGVAWDVVGNSVSCRSVFCYSRTGGRVGRLNLVFAINIVPRVFVFVAFFFVVVVFFRLFFAASLVTQGFHLDALRVRVLVV
jgi:hypothetical protein